ncbi:lytic transglycosylase domain-containing protein [Pseudolysinimonas sp.]|uniref:lytic transglycosylase domain-containing protein n=1 Tax=Pseudolysinimonas sp. TaxID=2680009 RepID=UPI003F7F04AF
MLEPTIVAGRGRVVAGVLGGAVGVVVVVLLVLALVPRAGGGSALAPAPTPAPSWAPPAALPPRAATPGPLGIGGLADPVWVADTARKTGIPARALAAYAGAALNLAEVKPQCGMSWNLLAGIGRVESDHGRHGGSSIGADGTVSPPIYGPALDGNGVALIKDSDGGAIDGDAQADRAVGPMQLIPEAWRNWHIDGNADGKEDPQNIEDSVLAAARYLCRASTALQTEQGWRAAVSAYNAPAFYLAEVARYADQYRREAGD